MKNLNFLNAGVNWIPATSARARGAHSTKEHKPRGRGWFRKSGTRRVSVVREGVQLKTELQNVTTESSKKSTISLT